MFSPEELAQIKAEAKVEAAEAVKKHFVEKALSEIGIAKVEAAMEHFAGKPEATDSGFEVITPLPVADDEFRETYVYGIALRVNRTGSKVEVNVNGTWEERKQNHVNSKGKSAVVYLPNRMCRQSKSKDGYVSCRVSHLVLQAFSEMPQYMQDIYLTPKGPTIMFGLDLVEHLDGDRNNANLDNLAWSSRSKFLTACKVKMRRLNIAFPAI